MSVQPEIPMLRGSRPYADRLTAESRKFADSKYRFYRRVNWSYRYCDEFYDREAACFLHDPDSYLAGDISKEAFLPDVYSRKLRARQFLVSVLKVFAHWLFRLAGKFMDREIKARGISIYRKAYVDDVELVFDPREAGVVRAVYPFPLGLRRQVRYLKYLWRNRIFFKLDGNAYGLSDFIRLVVKRDLRSLIRLEWRAQFRQARAILKLGIRKVQLSDEYDLGSLDMTRYLARYPVRVINSAHGVGLYLPFHCYDEFFTITRRQEEYYTPIRKCAYSLRQLNDVEGGASTEVLAGMDGVTTLVLLGQVVSEDEYIAQSEDRLIEFMAQKFAQRDDMKLYYKPHPNRKTLKDMPGFAILKDLGEVNGRDGTIFASFYSTCQIEPKFKGTKVLITTDVIRPEIFFGDDQTILTFDKLVTFVNGFCEKRKAGAA